MINSKILILQVSKRSAAELRIGERYIAICYVCNWSINPSL